MALLMLIPLLLYLAAAFLPFLSYEHGNYVVEAGEVAPHPFWDEVIADFTLVSGQYFPLTWGDGLITLTLVLMLIGMLIAASTRATTVLGNMLAVIVLCAYIVLFLTIAECGTTTFFLLMMIALVATLATIAISMVASHSDVEALED
jgi:uncharacterized membrane protein (GlpM family)